VAGLVRPLLDVPDEAAAIEAAFPPHCIHRVDNPSVDDLAECLKGRGTWFFLGHGDAVVRGEYMPLFVGDNGVCETGLQAISNEALVSTMAANADMLKLVVLNGCKTLGLAREILHRCPTVHYIVCWETSSHSAAATIFGTAFAKALAEFGSGKRARVRRAFESAKAALLRQLEPGRLDGGVPVGLPRYALTDPEDARVVTQACPCAQPCGENQCPFIGRLIPPNHNYSSRAQLPPLAAGVPCVLCRANAA